METNNYRHLLPLCLREEPRKLAEEACRAYEGGAYRSAIVAIWTAYCRDFVAKLSELSLAGDKEAKAQIERVDKFTAKIHAGDNNGLRESLTFENEIVSLSQTKFEFVDAYEAETLSRLKADRNKSAHLALSPSEEIFRPGDDLVRHYIVEVMRISLTQGVVQGKAASEIFIQQISSNFFPRNTDDAVEVLRGIGVDQAKVSLVRAVSDELVFGAFDSSSPHYHKIYARDGVVALVAARPGDLQERVCSQLKNLTLRMKDGEVEWILPYIKRVSGCVENLDQAEKTKLETLVKSSNSKRLYGIVNVALSIDFLEDAAVERLRGFDSAAVRRVFAFGTNPRIIDRAVELFTGSKTWAEANENYENVIEPIIDQLGKDRAREILRSEYDVENDLVGSHALEKFKKEIIAQEILSEEDVQSISTEDKDQEE